MSASLMSAHSTATHVDEIVADVKEQLGESSPRALVFFSDVRLDGAALSARLRERFPDAEVIGCTTWGEFTDREYGRDSVAVFAMMAPKVRRRAAALATFEHGVQPAIQRAITRMSESLDAPIPSLERGVGIVLTAAHRTVREEEANRALGNAAPLMSFVGGTAGLPLAQLETGHTKVFCNGEESEDGSALLVLELDAPFAIVKTSDYAPSTTSFVVTKASVEERIVHELDGRPAAEVYGEAIGRDAASMSVLELFEHPVGVVIDGNPWVRVVEGIRPGGALRFGCAAPERAQLNLLRRLDRLIEGTADALTEARREVGGEIAGALVFNCGVRLLRLRQQEQEEAFHSVISGFPCAGFHTRGESWLAHMNDTLTALVIG